jgi:lipopolysaccharide biosynthesis glycosyltransferase
MVAKVENAVVLGLTKNFTFALASVLMDIRRTWAGPTLPRVFVYHDGISLNESRILSNLYSNLTLVRYRPSLSWRTLKSRATRYFTPMVFSKFECFRIATRFESVLWLDYDQRIVKDLSPLFRSPTNMFLPGGLHVAGQFTRPLEDYDMNREGVAGGAFLIKKSKIDGLAAWHRSYRLLDQYADRLLMGEQGIIDLVIQDLALEFDPLDPEVYGCHPNSRTRDAVILHCWGQPKFWNGLMDSEWQHNYEQWMLLGGNPYLEDVNRKRIRWITFPPSFSKSIVPAARDFARRRKR